MTFPANSTASLASENSPADDDSGMFAAGIPFASLGVSPDYVEALAKRGIVTPTKAQAAVIPLLLHGLEMQTEYATRVCEAGEAQRAAEEGERALVEEVIESVDGDEAIGEDSRELDQNDESPGSDDVPERPRPSAEDVNDVMMVGAETGSGKTLAYLLPYVETVRRSSSADMKAVILVPSRELCWQVATFLTSYFPDAPMHLVLAGGNPPDVSDIKKVRVVIATPSALLNYFRFSQKPDASDKMIVVDEADMLLSGGFLRDIEQILDQPGMKPFATRKNRELRALNRNRLLFIGATYPHWTGERVRSIVTWMRRRYPEMKAVQTEDIHKKSARLRSRWQFLKTEEERLDALVEILEKETTPSDKVMVFASKAETSQRVCDAVLTRMSAGPLTEKFGEALQLHKHVRSNERQENLAKFRSGEGRLLFCTDLGSRGLDLGDVTRVVEFEFATNVVAYLHRIGRTARAGASGKTDHFYDEVSRPLADAIQERAEKETTVVEGVFSRNRSFRRKLKKREAEGAQSAVGASQTVAVSMDEVPIDEIDAEEEERLRG